MPAWTTTRFSVSEVNTVVTVVSEIVSYCMTFLLAAVSLEIRRLMIVRGERDAILQDEGFRAMGRALGKSTSKSLTFLAILPVLLGCAASTIIDFTTSGVSASVGHVAGDEVKVLGLAGSGIVEHLVSFPSIANVTTDASTEETTSSTGYLALLSPDLASVGFKSNISGYEVVRTHKVGSAGESGVFVSGNTYEPPLTVSMSFCVEIADLGDGVFSIEQCREGLIVERISRVFKVLALPSETGLPFVHDVTIGECSQVFHDIPLGNQGVGIVERTLTLMDSDAEVNATCAAITESKIESCVWKHSGVLYFGDWIVPDAGSCTGESGNAALTVIGIEYEPEVGQGSDAASFLAAMTAEMFSGTGKLTSRQQLTEVLGVVVRLESMTWGVQVAYDPDQVVEIAVCVWVPVVLALALVFPAVAWGFIRSRSGNRFFLPTSPAEWSACAAREATGDDDPVRIAEDPLDKHYDQVYAFGPAVTDKLGGVSQRLGWVNKQAVSPEISPVTLQQQLSM